MLLYNPIHHPYVFHSPFSINVSKLCKVFGDYKKNSALSSKWAINSRTIHRRLQRCRLFSKERKCLRIDDIPAQCKASSRDIIVRLNVIHTDLFSGVPRPDSPSSTEESVSNGLGDTIVS